MLSIEISLDLVAIAFAIGRVLDVPRLRRIRSRHRAEQWHQAINGLGIDLALRAHIALPGWQIRHNHELIGMPVRVGDVSPMQEADVTLLTGLHDD